MFERLFGRETDEKRFERLRSEIRALDERTEQLERTVKNLKLEWEESYDKLHHLMARVTKRAKVTAEDDSTAPEPRRNDFPAREGERANGGILGTHSVLHAMRGRHGLLPR